MVLDCQCICIAIFLWFIIYQGKIYLDTVNVIEHLFCTLSKRDKKEIQYKYDRWCNVTKERDMKK